MASEKPEPVSYEEQDVAALQREIALTEARANLADARTKLVEAEDKATKARQPWWRSGLTVTALAAMISAVVPLTAQTQSWKDQALKEKEKNFEIRDKYLTTVIRDPRHEQTVLEFIVATADDSKIRVWADSQLKRAKEKITILEDRKRLYLETIGVVSKLADREIGETEWQAQRARFWHLYRTDLLPVESPVVESLMVRIGQIVEKCHPGECQAIEGLAYELARQMKAEIRADSSPGVIPESDAPAR